MRVLTCLYVFSVYSQGGLLKSQTSVLDLARKRSPLHFEGNKEKIGEWLRCTETFCGRLGWHSLINWAVKINWLRRTAREKQEEIELLEDKIENKLNLNPLFPRCIQEISDFSTNPLYILHPYKQPTEYICKRASKQAGGDNEMPKNCHACPSKIKSG